MPVTGTYLFLREGPQLMLQRFSEAFTFRLVLVVMEQRT